MTCPNCHKLLLPYVYAEYSRELYEMEKAGLILMGMGLAYEPGYPTYYCRYCHENHYFIDADIVKIASKKSYAKKQKTR